VNSKEICEEISFPSFFRKCWCQHFCWDSRLIISKNAWLPQFFFVDSNSPCKGVQYFSHVVLTWRKYNKGPSSTLSPALSHYRCYGLQPFKWQPWLVYQTSTFCRVVYRYLCGAVIKFWFICSLDLQTHNKLVTLWENCTTYRQVHLYHQGPIKHAQP